MGVLLKSGIDPGKTHEERLTVARRIADLCLEKHGDRIAAICVYGSAAVDLDMPYSDLDITVLTRVDLDRETRGFTHDGLTVNLDYQTIDDTIEEEIQVPGEGGAWSTVRVLHDPDGVVEGLRARYAKLTNDNFRRRFAAMMADHLPTHMGKVRNGVIAKDRVHFLRALQEFGDKVCKALCLLNRQYVTGERAMLAACRELERLPARFAQCIDVVLGAVEAPDQERYDAAEALWEGMQRLAGEAGIDWRTKRLDA